MSEFTATIDAYFDNVEQRNTLIDLLSNNKTIEISGESFSVQDYDIGELVNFTLWAGGHDQTKLVTSWLSAFKPKFPVIECFSDQSEKRLAFEDGKKQAFKTVVQGLSGVSKRYEAGLAFKGSMRNAIAFLKSSDVDVSDVFQGERHIDRITDQYDPDHDTKIYELLIDQGKITTELLLDDTPEEEGQLAIFCLNPDLVIRVLRNGGNPGVVDNHTGDNLLTDFSYYPDEERVAQLDAMLSLGVDVNHTNARGLHPIAKFFKDLDPDADVEESEELYLLAQLKSLIDYGADPYSLSVNGPTCLSYVQGYDLIKSYLTENFKRLTM